MGSADGQLICSDIEKFLHKNPTTRGEGITGQGAMGEGDGACQAGGGRRGTYVNERSSDGQLICSDIETILNKSHTGNILYLKLN